MFIYRGACLDRPSIQEEREMEINITVPQLPWSIGPSTGAAMPHLPSPTSLLHRQYSIPISEQSAIFGSHLYLPFFTLIFIFHLFQTFCHCWRSSISSSYSRQFAIFGAHLYLPPSWVTTTATTTKFHPFYLRICPSNNIQTYLYICWLLILFFLC